MNPLTSNLPGRPVYVVDGCRTPFLKSTGKPGPFRASDLALAAARALLMKLPIAADQLDEVILGCVAPGPDEANIARILALRLGCNERTPAMTVQRNCASGMQALDTAALDIACGRAEMVLAGGAEAMSHSPVLLSQAMVNWLALWSRARSLPAKGRALGQLRMQYLKPVIGLLRGLTDPVVGVSMGQTAEKLAQKFYINREQMDAYAIQSHNKLQHANEQNHLEEITPLYDSKGQYYADDNGLRADSSMEKLAQLKPVFDRPYGAVTAGNSAQVTDGAACLLLASEEAVEKYDLPVLGRILDSQWAGLDPSVMGLGPVYAMAPLLERHGLNTRDVDYWEINEAFAAQVLACLKAWQDADFATSQLNLKTAFAEIPEDRLNVDGGAISIGHPVGASGARIVLHLLKTLHRERSNTGIASLCIGGGQGGAMLVQNCNGREH
jgi:acetyl-CoA C-acetyltransferase